MGNFIFKDVELDVFWQKTVTELVKQVVINIGYGYFEQARRLNSRV